VQEVANFVACLSQSIEELYIDLGCGELACEIRGDCCSSEPLTDKVFRSLNRLHTFDLGGLESERGRSYQPEYALFCRRRPTDQDPDNSSKKSVLISRLGGEYEGERVKVRNTVEELQGNFKGRDADEPWLGGERSWVTHKNQYWVNGE
jgi:hypothetical protein